MEFREFDQLSSVQVELLENFYKFNDLKELNVKTAIISLLEKYRQILSSIESELEFKYEINIDSFKYGKCVSDEEIVPLLASYHESNEFLTNFKKQLISKQYELKNKYKENFQLEKNNKYYIKVDANEPIQEDAIITDTTQDAKIMATTKKITSKLIQSSQILQSSLMQSQLNLEELTIQNDSLTELSDKYTFLKGVLEKSDGFINDIKLSTEKDKRKMYYALIFFSLCVAYVLYRRMFKLFFNLLFYTIKLAFGIFGLFKSNKPALGNTESDFISPTLVDDGNDEIIYETATEIEANSIESAVYDDSQDDVVKEVNDEYEEIKNDIDENIDDRIGRIIDEL